MGRPFLCCHFEGSGATRNLVWMVGDFSLRFEMTEGGGSK